LLIFSAFLQKTRDRTPDVPKYITFFLVVVLVLLFGTFLYSRNNGHSGNTLPGEFANTAINNGDFGQMEKQPHPLSIESLRIGEYPGSELTLEQELPNGSNYKRQIVSYKSEGLKIYALLTVPLAEPPQGGYPVVVFNHGYIPPSEYRTTEKYTAYTDAFSRNGYVLLRSDYRGHGNSEGTASGGYGSNDYTIDVLNAVASIKKYPGVNPEKIGMWGHSMGGFVTLRNMVVSKDIKVGVIWAEVVASYDDLLNNWRRRSPMPSPTGSRGWRGSLVAEYGEPGTNSEFWNSISANSYLKNVSGSIQIHHGAADSSVPVEFSEKLDIQLKEASKTSELFIYQGDDHNLTSNLGLALNRSVEFINKYLK